MVKTIKKTILLPIQYDSDILKARESGRALGAEFGCAGSRLVMLTSVVSSSARKLLAQALPGALSITMSRGAGMSEVAIELSVRVQLAGGETMGVPLPTEWRSMGNFELIHLPGETILRWTEQLDEDKDPPAPKDRKGSMPGTDPSPPSEELVYGDL